MDGGQSRFAGRRRAGFGQRNITPFHLRARRPTKVQFDGRVRGPGRRPINVGDLGPAGRVGIPIGRVLRLGERRFARRVAVCARFVAMDGLLLVITPQDAGEHAAARGRHMRHTAQRAEAVVMSTLNGKGFSPMAIQTLTVVRANKQAAMTGGSALWFELERRLNFLTRRGALPAFRRWVRVTRLGAHGGA